MKGISGRKNGNTKTYSIIIISSLPVILGIVSLMLGKYPISPGDLILIIKNKMLLTNYDIPSTMETVIFNVRLPRLIAAFIIGGGLSVSGAVYQGIFNNPLVSPDILGATSGASFGAAIAIVMSLNVFRIQIFAFLFGILAVALTCFICSLINQNNKALILVLTGILTSAVFSSMVSLVKFLADPENKLPAITYWLMGSLSTIKKSDTAFLIIPAVVSTIALFSMRWSLNVLSFGDEEAQTMGINTTVTRLVIIFFSTLLTSSSVAVCGAIGWVGLVVPNLVRFLIGPDYRMLIPVSFIAGGSFLLIVDTIARTFFTVEIPLGIIISLIGGPFYVWLLARSTRRG